MQNEGKATLNYTGKLSFLQHSLNSVNPVRGGVRHYHGQSKLPAHSKQSLLKAEAALTH